VNLVVLPAVALCLAGAGCGREAGFYPVPYQRTGEHGPDPSIGAFVRMADPAAEDYVVRDVSPEPADLRWAMANPELCFRVEDVRGLRFAVEFTIAERTFRDTGPVTVAVEVTGRPLGSMRCDHPGPYRFEQAVPSGWMEPGLVPVKLEARPVWVSPGDGARLSFLVRSAGFLGPTAPAKTRSDP
jgi:hypothetical protein